MPTPFDDSGYASAPARRDVIERFRLRSGHGRSVFPGPRRRGYETEEDTARMTSQQHHFRNPIRLRAGGISLRRYEVSRLDRGPDISAIDG